MRGGEEKESGIHGRGKRVGGGGINKRVLHAGKKAGWGGNGTWTGGWVIIETITKGREIRLAGGGVN